MFINRVSAWTLLVGLLCVSLARPAPTFAHDVPRDVTVQAYAKPEGRRFTLLVRVPLKAIMDVEFPRRDRDLVDLARVDQSLRDAANVWLANRIELYEDDVLLARPRIAAARLSLEADRSFASYAQALAHITGEALPHDTAIFWEQGLLDVLFDYSIRSDRSKFSIHARFERLGLRVVTSLRFLPPASVERAFELEGDAGLIRLDPSWRQAAEQFVRLGFWNTLGGAGHLLFLCCLVIPFRRFGSLVPIVIAFTVAHSITLVASAFNYAPGALWFPPLVDTLIAVSILYMALDNLRPRLVGSAPTATGRGNATARFGVMPRWIVAFGFGLVHGFGFSFGLQHMLQFAGSHLLTSVLSFNAGVELGQLTVLVLLIPALDALFRFVVAERMGTIILSAILAHTAWHWTVDGVEILRRSAWPATTGANLAQFLIRCGQETATCPSDALPGHRTMDRESLTRATSSS